MARKEKRFLVLIRFSLSEKLKFLINLLVLYVYSITSTLRNHIGEVVKTWDRKKYRYIRNLFMNLQVVEYQIWFRSESFFFAFYLPKRLTRNIQDKKTNTTKPTKMKRFCAFGLIIATVLFETVIGQTQLPQYSTR